MSRRLACATLVAIAVTTACSDVPGPRDGDKPAPPRFGVAQVRDVPAVTIDLPPEPRPWDTSAVALEEAIAAEDGHAVTAFKAPGSARALETGRREAVPTAAIEQALGLLADRGVTVIKYWPFMGAAHVQFPPAAAAALRDHDLVDYIEPRQWWSVQGVGVRAPIEVFRAPTLIAQTTPWGIQMVRAPEAWSAATGATAKIQIIDTGHDRGQEDLPLVPLSNCAGALGGCDDGPFWHGTHVLGIFTARDNPVGVIGAAHGVAPSDVFVYGACHSGGQLVGRCETAEIITGIEGSLFFDVLNMSLGGPIDFGAGNAVQQAWNGGVVIVAAAGNRGSAQLSPANIYPAAYANVLGVSGVRTDKTFAGSSPCPWPDDPSQTAASNQGQYVDLSAPFWALSTVGNNAYEDETQGWCGTSMATPHVSGAAALLRAQNPAWSNADIVNRLQNTAQDRGALGRDDRYGYGIVDACAAVGVCAVIPPALPSVTISGPTNVQPGAACTWFANVSGGTPPYVTYSWTPPGDNSPELMYTNSGESFTVSVWVTDAAGASGFDSHSVTVSSGAPACKF